MAQPYVGEIRMFAGSSAPVGWMSCEGQLLPISENETLFNLIGTTYGGDGQSTFALPDLRGRFLSIHFGNGFTLAETGGVETTLTVPQIQAHTHSLLATPNAGDQGNPDGNVVAQNTAVQLYIEDLPNVNTGAQEAMLPGQGPGLPLDELGETSDGGNSLARVSGLTGPYLPASPAPTLVTMSDNAVAPAGGDQPHNNLQPYLTLSFCIALQGVYPPRT